MNHLYENEEYLDQLAEQHNQEDREREKVLEEIRQTTVEAISLVTDPHTRIAMKQLFLYITALHELT